MVLRKRKHISLKQLLSYYSPGKQSQMAYCLSFCTFFQVTSSLPKFFHALHETLASLKKPFVFAFKVSEKSSFSLISQSFPYNAKTLYNNNCSKVKGGWFFSKSARPSVTILWYDLMLRSFCRRLRRTIATRLCRHTD